MSTSVLRERGRLYGPWERPQNIAADRKGSIHDDDRAQRLGFRGAIVSARVHLNVFVPVLLEAFGPRWFEAGTISQDFKVGTLHEEEVRAVLGAPPEDPVDAQVQAHLERPDGEVIALGTASAGRPRDPTWLDRKDQRCYDEGPYELVANVTPGDVFPEGEVTLSPASQERLVGGVPHPWYTSESPWGAPVACPGAMVQILGSGCGRYLWEHRITGVPVDGGTELRNVNGPVLIGTPYVSGGRVIARGRSPRTEYFWYEGWVDDLDGNRVAEMRLQWRSMKAPGE